jgi:glycerol kinase
MSGILVIDVGTSSVRAAIVDPDGGVSHVSRRPTAPASPFPGLVEFDPMAIATAATETARDTMSRYGARPAGMGVTTQRASTVAWDARTGRPLGSGLGWQDLRTVGKCLEMQATGWRFSPSESATKFAWHVQQAAPCASAPWTAGSPGI